MGAKGGIIKATVRVNKKLFPKGQNPTDNDFKILSVEPEEIVEGNVEVDETWGTFVIKGSAPDVNMRDTYSVTLKEGYHPQYGKQYEIMYMGKPTDLSGERAQKIFLSNILTDKQVESLYNTLDNPFQAIVDENVKEITKCKGFGAKTANKLFKKYKETIDYSEAYVELDGYGLTKRMIEKLVDRYKSPNLAVKKVKENPYVLAEEVEGIGFIKADDIALKSGISPKSPFRIKAFISFYLNEQSMEGFSYMHPSELFGQLFESLSLNRKDKEVATTIKKVLHELKKEDKIWFNDDRSRISSKYIRDLERKTADELLRLNSADNDFVYDDWEDIVAQTEKRQGWEFTDEQMNGIQTVLENQVTIVTGLGGSGKTSVVTGMLDVLKRRYTFAQAALSGRAGARLAEVTGEEGHTIHRLLGYNPHEGGFLFNKKNPLEYDIIILDEISMVGIDIFYSLVSAMKDGAKLVAMGDFGQLQSIGAGNLSIDIVESGVVPVVNLTKIHRQAQKSAIITEGVKVREGTMLAASGFTGTEIRGELQDLELDIYQEGDYTRGRILKHFKEKLGTVPSIIDLQVIVPMKYRGESCTFELNKDLQKIYNPANKNKDEVKISLSKDKKFTIRVGDKILNKKNNYEAYNTNEDEVPVFNGDMGIVREIKEKEMLIEFHRIGDILIPKDKWKDLELAYAVTTHKMQGSEAHTVIIGIDYSSYVLLTKELIYTAISRARKYCILCAENAALSHAIRTSKVIYKRTFLKEFLQEDDICIDSEED